MRVREGRALNEVEAPEVDGCAGMMGAWEFIKLFCQLLCVLKILYNKSFKNEHEYIPLLVIIDKQKPRDITLCLSDCQKYF